MVNLQALLKAFSKQYYIRLTNIDLSNVQVTEVMVMATPDVKNWLIPGELVLTSLFGLTIDQQKRLVNQLKREGAAGLIIKTNAYLKQVPSELIKFGQALQFPLIQIQQLTYRSIIDCFNRLKMQPVSVKETLFGIEAEQLLTAALNNHRPSQLAPLAVKLGLKIHDPVRLMTLSRSHHSIETLRRLQWLVKSNFQRVLIGVVDQYIYVLIADQIDFQVVLGKIVPELPNEHFLVSSAGMLNQLPSRRHQLTNLRHLVAESKPKAAVIVYDELGIDQLFVNIDPKIISQALPMAQLITLQQKSPELFKSLRAYFQANLNLTKAAKALFVHPKSLSYRLHKIEDLLKIDLTDPKQLLYLNFASYFLTLYSHKFKN